MRPERRATRDQIVGLFWGNRDSAHARSSLSDALWHLRRVLGREALVSAGDEVAIVANAPLTVDALELVSASAQGDDARVVALYTGPFLDGLYVDDAREFDDWRDRERARLAALFARSARVVSGTLARASRWDERRALAERWLEAEPLSPEAGVAVIESLAAEGEGTRQANAVALEAYERLLRRLRDDYGTEPDSAVIAAARESARRIADPAGRSGQIAAETSDASGTSDRGARFLEHLNQVLDGRYEVIRLLERTSLAMVVLARDAAGDQRVLRVLHPAIAATLDVDMLLGELRKLMKLEHESLVPIVDAGAGHGLVYFATPVLSGESLRDRMSRERPLPVSEAISIARQLAESLAEGHSAGVLHLDLKPRHVWLSPHRVQLAEVGLAYAIRKATGDTATRSGVTLGTPAYMAPEQVTGNSDLDARTDVYALGCLFYEMLTGSPPFAGPTAQAALVRRLSESPAPLRVRRPDAPAGIEALIRRMMERAPDDRFSSGVALLEAFVPLLR